MVVVVVVVVVVTICAYVSITIYRAEVLRPYQFCLGQGQGTDTFIRNNERENANSKNDHSKPCRHRVAPACFAAQAHYRPAANTTAAPAPAPVATDMKKKRNLETIPWGPRQDKGLLQHMLEFFLFTPTPSAFCF